jgi:hypothetical protein
MDSKYIQIAEGKAGLELLRHCIVWCSDVRHHSQLWIGVLKGANQLGDLELGGENVTSHCSKFHSLEPCLHHKHPALKALVKVL